MDYDLPNHLGGHAGKTNIDEGALRWAVNKFNIKSMLDIGCGPGDMVKLATEKNLNAKGIDGDFTLERFDKEKFILHDYTEGPIHKLKKFDLAWSVEFVEHVYEEYIPSYMPSFQKCKYVIITYAPPGWPGHHHVNCRTESYWIDKFTEYGFTYSKDYTDELRQNSTMNIHRSKKAFVRNRGLFFSK